MTTRNPSNGDRPEIARRQSTINTSGLEHEVDIVLQGKAVVKSYDGTSQYTQRGVSACGLASFNAVKTVLELELSGIRGPDLIYQMLSKELVEHAIAICSLWSSSSHLEVEDISRFSFFSRALHLVHTVYTSATYEHFANLLQRLHSITTSTSSCAAIITKPPEILAVFAIATDQSAPLPSAVFAVFDSHSRPVRHPRGSAFSFFGNASDTAEYLASLLSIDPEVLKDPRMHWQAQLLSQFSAHCFTAMDQPTAARDGAGWKQELDMELFKANMAVLDAKSVLTEMKSNFSELQSKYAGAMATSASMKDELGVLREELRRMREALAKSESEREEVFMDLDVKEEGKGKGKAVGADDADHSPPPQDGFVSWSDAKATFPSIPNPLNYIPGNLWPAASSRPSGSGHKATPSRRATEPNRTGEPTSQNAAHRNIAPQRSQTGDDAMDKDHDLAATLHLEDAEERRQETMQMLQNQLLRDAHIAAKIQRELDQELEAEKATLAAVAALTQRTFDCGICFETNPEDMVAIPEGCNHEFCRECLTSHAESTLDQMKYPIWCPVCATGDEKQKDSRGIVTQWVVEMLGLSEEQYHKLVQLELANVSVQLQCPKCHETVLVDRADHQEAEIFECPMKQCDNLWCKTCLQTVTSPLSEDHSCDGTKELDKLMGTTGWKRCPGCQTLIERTEGCDHMTCRAPGCNTHFSYTTGAKMNT